MQTESIQKILYNTYNHQIASPLHNVQNLLEINAINPFCGDKTIIYAICNISEIITEAMFYEESCTASKMTANLICDTIKGLKLSEALQHITEIKEFIKTEKIQKNTPQQAKDLACFFTITGRKACILSCIDATLEYIEYYIKNSKPPDNR